MPQDFPLVIVGGNSMVGKHLMQRLHDKGYVADVISRRPMEVPDGFSFTLMDLTKARNWIAPEGAVVISLLPLWVLAHMLPRFMGIKRLIATGSTSRFNMAGNMSAKERSLAATLEAAENVIQEWTARCAVQWNILRTTLIYDGKTDKNITRMARFIRRWHCLPLAAPASGLRQPIHADDVAIALIACLEHPEITSHAFNIAGGEILSYRTLVERVFTAQGLAPRFIWLPTQALVTAFRLITRLGLFRASSFGAGIFTRMNQDLIFDVQEGREKLGLSPRRFELEQ